MEKVGSFLFLIFGIGPFLVSSFWPSVWSLILTDSPFLFRLRRLFNWEHILRSLLLLTYRGGWAGPVWARLGLGGQPGKTNILQYMHLNKKTVLLNRM